MTKRLTRLVLTPRSRSFMVEHDAGWPQKLNDFMSLFGDAFRRRDQRAGPPFTSRRS